ncbi:MAG: undecaprenyldiphospho-muramoylpentapeptide beta-N-acetylglucosaminyltransferase [Candidatus Moranbacteria bacterium RIFCSPHIGHO2_01_FULL_55_24]|nr:MAG: undecaprenyldiphospho-muramoylpentapeptide beta-N-acetylglucosaminyltransferase [Candidatus Moranbacteria bacterium RIFCSPHIGHO2_01_FULL_55_24]
MQKGYRIVLTGGVSGGHTFPLLAVAETLAKRRPGEYEFLFIGPKGKFGAGIMDEYGIPAKYVMTGKWRRYFSLQNFVDPFKIPLGFFQSLWYLFRFMPDAVFSKGGSASVPVVLAARFYRIPVLIHDSDATAGYANRFLGRFASRIAIAYPSARSFFDEKKTALTGNPVREEVLAGDKARGAGLFRLSAEKPTLLIIGGSLGARTLNEALLRILPELLERGIQVLHQTGIENHEAIIQAVRDAGIDPEGSGYRPQAFFSGTELADAYELATVVLSRAGAGSIAEIAAHQKPAILVPLGSAANDEQRLNAYEIAHIGGAVVIEEPNLGEHILLRTLEELFADPAKREALGKSIGAFYHPDAAQAIADGLEALIAA